MKPTTVTVQAVSTVGTAAETMTIDPQGMATVLSILSNMYSDGNLAVVREYASNALDSHMEAGNDGPILITSPSHFNPVLVIQDFGTGLTRDEVLGVYARYGASTKRASDAMIGSFGIGAKSAFTVGAQFVVTAVKDGMMTMALFALDATGAPTVNIIGHEPTDEPNGVKVEISVKDVDGVVGAIERLFSTWAPGTVLVDGVEPNHIWADVEEMVDGVHIGWKVATRAPVNSWTLIMGGIPYGIPDSVVSALEYRSRTIVQSIRQSQAVVYLTVPIGAVDITPSREELRNTPKTVTAVNDMIEKFHLALGGWVAGQIADAPSLISAMIKVDELKRNLGGLLSHGSHRVTWNGTAIPDSPVKTKLNYFKLGRKRGGGMIARRGEDFDAPPSALLHQIMFITDVPDRKLRTVQITAKEFLEAQDGNSMDQVRIVVPLPPCTSRFVLDWLTTDDPAVRTMDFATFVTDWKPTTAPSARRGAVMYNISGGQPRSAADLKSETTIYYLTHYDRPRINVTSDFARSVIGSTPLVMLKSTQKAHVLVQRLPQAVNLVNAVTKSAETFLNGVTQADMDALDADHVTRAGDHSILRFLREFETDITHTGVLALLDQYDRAEQLTASQRARVDLIRSALRITSRSQDTLGRSTWDVGLWDKVLNGLPLLSTYFIRDWMRTGLGNTHAVAYINMAEGLTDATTA